MRLKLVLLVQSKMCGNILPASYQYELSSCIHKKITENAELYEMWLQMNGFPYYNDANHKLFSISNFYIPKIKAEEDRLYILAKRVQLWISFLPERGTREIIERIFDNQILCIGDKRTRVQFLVESIKECTDPVFSAQMEYLSLSPIVFTLPRPNLTFEYLGPEDDNYPMLLMENLLEKYRYFYGKDFPGEPECRFALLTPPKRKGIYIKRFTPSESKIIGYMYKFSLRVHPTLHRLLYHTGIGEQINYGFGCVEILNKDFQKEPEPQE